MNFIKIEKEEIAKLHFSSGDVLASEDQKKYRELALQNAVKLGNTEKQKCRIVFHSVEGDGFVETTVWAVTDKYICLKGGLALLIASVLDVIF